MTNFVHCHVHSEYSLLDGVSRIKDIVAKAKEYNMPAVAITDHGVMYGAIEFYKEAYEAGIKPIIGCEVYVSPTSRLDRKSKDKSQYHLVLLAKNETGYKNLIKLCSIGFLEGFYYKPRVDKEVLEKHSEGLIALTACLGGEVPHLLLQDKDKEAKKAIEWYKEHFDFYLELQDHNLPEQKKVNTKLIELSKKYNIPLVATNDSHYTLREDAKAQDILLCIQTNRLYNEPDRMRFPGGPEYYFKSTQEMCEIFKDVPDAIKNTIEIANKCNLSIKMNEPLLPSYPLPPNKTAESYLAELTWNGLKKRFKEITPKIEQRLNYELSVIEKMGFAPYFLIVWDYINYSKKNGIITGPGRGSAAGSLVAYCLGITDINPLEYNLLFERFLNPERISMPDIDIDFCVEGREKVINYVTEKYSQERVSQIITLGTMGAKMAIRDVGRVLGFSPSETDRLAKLLPSGLNVKLDDGLQEGQELFKEYKSNPRVKELIDIAKSLEGIARHGSIHAAGVVISKEPIANVVPLQKMQDGQIVTQYQMTDLEKLGLLKMDFLGLRNLTMISKTLDIIKQRTGKEIDISSIPYDDTKTYELLQSGETIGIFQLESSGMRKLVKRLAPSNFEEIIALIALYRPGPLKSGMVDDYVDRKHGLKKIEYPHPSLEPILKDTYGVYVYQEQIMQTAQVIAGYTLGQADILRKAMGKKKPEEMAKQKAIFIEGAIKNGIQKELAESLFSDMEKFAEYGFNKSHSAAYAVITYRTAYLKANYPLEYMTALLSSVIGNPDKLIFYLNECRRMNIELLPPDINNSLATFTIEGKNKIRFGLNAIKNVGENAVLNIIESREKLGKFTSFYDFCCKVDLHTVNKRTIESLVLSGAFDSLNVGHRRQLQESINEFISYVSKDKEKKSCGQSSLFECLADDSINLTPTLKECEPYGPEKLLSLEKEIVGVYISSHPLLNNKEMLDILTTHTIADLEEEEQDKDIVIGGIISGLKFTSTKKQETMAIIQIEDLTGTIEVVAYPETFQKYKELINLENKVIIYGKIVVNGKEENKRVIVSSIKNLECIKILYINISKNLYNLQKLVSLRTILEKYKGDIPVILSFEDRKEKIVINNELWVQENPNLLTELSNFFKNKCFYFK